MLVRFGDQSLERLFESGVDDTLSADAIRAFFGVIEAVAAARDLNDVRALISLDVVESDSRAISLRVERALRLSATIEEGDDGSMLRVDAMIRESGDRSDE